MITGKTYKVIAAAAVLLLLLAGLPYAARTYSVRTVDMEGDLSESFRTVDELSDHSDYIVKVKTTDTDSFQYEGVVFTVTTAAVEEVIKGHLEEGEKIRLLETGGTTNFTKYTFDGNEVFKKNQQAYVFLERYQGPVTQDAYVIRGAYQGKFVIDPSGEIRIPEGVSGDLSQMYSGLSK